jgi:predicted cupin superfamily sugar epimerase
MCHYRLHNGRCRTHHKIKAERGWKLTQPAPGHFELTTPTGRTYTTTPDAYRS